MCCSLRWGNKDTVHLSPVQLIRTLWHDMVVLSRSVTIALLPLVLVLDNEGFPKASRVLEGNISEPRTAMIRQEGFHYITVSRQRPREIPEEGFTMIKEDKDSTIEVKRLDGEGETILYCQNTAGARKEE